MADGVPTMNCPNVLFIIGRQASLSPINLPRHGSASSEAAGCSARRHQLDGLALLVNIAHPGVAALGFDGFVHELVDAVAQQCLRIVAVRPS